MILKKENVWDYPRPAIWEYHSGTIEVIQNNQNLAKTNNAIRVLETSHPPTYYVPEKHVMTSLLHKNDKTSFCEWKGLANYYDYEFNNTKITNIAWSYSDPNSKFLFIKNFISFYASKIDLCLVNSNSVIKQEGEFYGGWITANLTGPFKGGEGTEEW